MTDGILKTAGPSELASKVPKLKAQLGTRGERLYPCKTNRLYWILTQLRTEIESIIAALKETSAESRAKLIDFGCGDAPYRPLFEPYVGCYIGCDLPGNSTAECTLLQPDVLPFEDGDADIILSTQVLEHVQDPARYLAECARVLKNDGRLFLSTHGVWKYHPDPIDLWRWTSAGLRKIVEDAGFTVTTFRGVLGPAAYGIQIWQDAVVNRIPSTLRKTFIRAVQSRIAASDRACADERRNSDAAVFIVSARRTVVKTEE